MGNHVHLIATPQDERGLARLLQRLHSEYARALRTGDRRAVAVLGGKLGHFSRVKDRAAGEAGRGV